jgi:hypothetical protein
MPTLHESLRLKDIFTYHAPSGDQTARYTELRRKALDLALLIEANCPESREKSLALTNLQQTIMWANASIAINEVPPPARGAETAMIRPRPTIAELEEILKEGKVELELLPNGEVREKVGTTEASHG